MVNMETVEELAESIADSLEVYGCGCSDTDEHSDTCNCRICFVESMKERIVQAVHNDEMRTLAYRNNQLHAKA